MPKLHVHVYRIRVPFQMTTVIVMASMLVATGILEFIIAIWSSIVCCLIGVCNCCLASTPQTQANMFRFVR